jgi:predicted DsbA family dithiol-disulfide isomerase
LRPNAPENGWPLPDYVKARKGRPDNPLTLRAKQLGITLVERDWIPSSRRAHESTEYARAEGKLAAFHAGVLRAYWTEGKDLHDWDVLRAVATAAGLDGAAMQQAVESGQMKPVLEKRLAAARELGIHAVPLFVVGDKYVVEGAQTGEVFERVLEKLGTQAR